MVRPRVVLADDHPEFLGVIVALVEAEFEVQETVSDGQALVEAAVRLAPDAIVTDISMPRMSGIEAAQKVLEAGVTTKIVFLTVHQDPDFLRIALEIGAQGYVVKGRLATDLLPALRAVLAGKRFVSTS